MTQVGGASSCLSKHRFAPRKKQGWTAKDNLPMPLLKNNELKPASWTPCRLVLSGLGFMYSAWNKTENLIHRLHCAGQSEVLRGLRRWHDDPKASGATMYPTQVAKQVDNPDVAASVDADEWMPAEGPGHRLKSWRTFLRSSSWHITLWRSCRVQSFAICQAHCKPDEMLEIATVRPCTRGRNGSCGGKAQIRQ